MGVCDRRAVVLSRKSLSWCQEHADAAWILRIHKGADEARSYETVVAAKYKLPRLTFVAHKTYKIWTTEMVDEVYAALFPQQENVLRCLRDHELDAYYPFCKKENGIRQPERGKAGTFEVQACNLFSGYMAIPVLDGEFWEAVEVTSQPFSGSVYSLNIEQYHSYVADGLVTLNSIYAFAGADFDSVNRIVERLDAQLLPLRIVFRCGSSIVDIANQLCEDDEKLISAGLHTGKVEVIAAANYIEKLVPGRAAVIGRTTKRLVQGCLKVLQKGVKAKVLGKNLGTNIAAVVTRVEAMRIRRGVPALNTDLSNLLELLDEYKAKEVKILKESRKNPEMAVAELQDKVETCRAFFTAYVGKCYDPTLRVLGDPKCLFNKTAKDFKAYIHGLFSEDDNSKDFVLFMTARRSKGGEWSDVFILGSDEFPHPRAKSERQQQQEQNLMYVAVTRAIENLFFIDVPFRDITVPGYEPERGLTLISFPAADHLEIHSTEGVTVTSGHETVEPSIYDAPGFEDYDPEVVDTLFHDFLRESDADFQHQKDLGEQLLAEKSDRAFEREILGAREIILPFTGETIIVEAAQPGNELEVLTEGRVGRIAAIEVLCPTCGSQCVDRALESPMITYDLVGHIVICSSCHKACIVPLNAFSLEGNVFAREKPVSGTANHRVEKKGRTQKERKSKAGRKPKGQGVRQPMQLSLDSRVIKALNVRGVNKSVLFVELLQQYEPFLDVWAELEDAEEDSDELDHDEIEDK